MTIRAAHETDVEALQAIELDAAQRYAALPETRFCTALPVRDVAEHRAARNRGLALVVEVGGAAAGFLLSVPKDGRAHLLELAVAQKHQARGHGRALIAAFEAWAKDSGFAETTLTTFRDVPWNAPFYSRLGYKIIKAGENRPELAVVIEEECRAGFHGVPRVVMAKEI